MAETSTKPYMIRALYEWCCDNGYTPYLAVTVDEHTLVPRQHVKGGEIVLNVSPMATSRLSLGNELVEFQARFSGVAQQISIPVGNVSAIYARETGQGMAFEVTPAPAAQPRGDDEASGAGMKGSAADSGDEGGVHAPGSTVQSLRGGSRRRGPRRLDPDETSGSGSPAGGEFDSESEAGEMAGGEDHEGGSPSRNGADAPAANSRRRSSRGQGSADVIAFAPSGGDTEKKKGAGAARAKSGEAGNPPPVTASPGDDHDGDEPPPANGGGKGGKARLTRVK